MLAAVPEFSKIISFIAKTILKILFNEILKTRQFFKKLLAIIDMLVIKLNYGNPMVV